MPLQIVRNDITKMAVDAIVNAANNSLLGGGGVDGAIHRAAGPQLLEECRTLNGCRTGEAKITKGYRLPARYVIHTVGPVWRGGSHGERELVFSCYQNSLQLAQKQGCETVAFPPISSGVYGYPKAQALQVAVEAITQFLLSNEMTVYIVVFSKDAFEIGGRLFERVTAYIDDVYVEEHQDALEQQNLRCRAALENLKAKEKLLCPQTPAAMASSISLEEMLGQMDESFAQMMLRKIDEKHMTDAQCYKKANIDRRLFNKIKNNPAYRPGKQTALALAIALELSLKETEELLKKAGFALSHSSKSDIVVEYCILNGNYDIIEINEVLFQLDLQPLGY